MYRTDSYPQTLSIWHAIYTLSEHQSFLASGKVKKNCVNLRWINSIDVTFSVYSSKRHNFSLKSCEKRLSRKCAVSFDELHLFRLFFNFLEKHFRKLMVVWTLRVDDVPFTIGLKTTHKSWIAADDDESGLCNFNFLSLDLTLPKFQSLSLTYYLQQMFQINLDKKKVCQ